MRTAEKPMFGDAFMNKDNLQVFKSYKRYYEFGIEWQVATGTILAAFDKTRAAGEAKLEDAKVREKAMLQLIKDGKI